MLTKFVNPFDSKLSTFASFKTKWTSNNTDCQSTKTFCNTSDNWCSTCTRTTTHTSSDEDHVSTADCFCQYFFAFFCRFTTNFRLTSCTKSASQFRAELNNCLSFCTAQSLYICVGCDKFNARNAFVNHTVDGISTTTADTDYFNYCTLCCCCIK